MGATTGFSVLGDYSGTNQAAVQALIDLLPNPDAATGGSGAQAGGINGVANTYLDEMSPAAAAQLRVELLALKAAVENV